MKHKEFKGGKSAKKMLLKWKKDDANLECISIFIMGKMKRDMALSQRQEANVCF